MRLLMALLLVAMLAGCSNPSASDGSSNESPATGTTGLVGEQARDASPAAALPDLELFNDTLTFAAAGGGSAGSASFEVPAGYGNLTVTVKAIGDCPQGYSKAAGVAVTAPAIDATLPLANPFLEGMPVSDAGGYAPYTCAIADVAGMHPADLGDSLMSWPTQPGAGSLAAKGEFTGEALVVVVASA